jgi:ABC-type Fe3+/spermidine/putrescine transport system ATPase subunit
VVFQNHSLLPWLTVYANVKIAVDKVFGGTKSRQERHDWIMHNLDLVQMAHAKDKRPGRDLRRHEAARGPWPARWRWSRRCCCLTSRSARSMR